MKNNALILRIRVTCFILPFVWIAAINTTQGHTPYFPLMGIIQSPTPTPVPTTVPAAETQRQPAVNRENQSNLEEYEEDTGIGLTDPKIFDNRSLTIMLNQLNESLDRVQFVDKLKLAAAIGLTQGSQASDVARALNITSPRGCKKF